MSILTWGDLQKSQDDPETIEEAIARLIQAHDDDESAHLDTGQALESHKASDIIDHRARSLYRDKMAFDRFQIDEQFNSMDAWSITAGVTHDGINQVSLVTTAVTNNRQRMMIKPYEAIENAGIPATSPNWEVRAKTYNTTNQRIYIQQGDEDVPAGYGFKIVNNTLYSFYVNGEDTEMLNTVTGVTLTNFNRYRCEFKNGEYLKWYVNDILVDEIGEGLPAGWQMFINISITNTAVAIKTMYVQSAHYDEDYSS